MNILHLNDKTAIKGGVEVYVEQLMQLLPDYDCTPHWLGIYQGSAGYAVNSYGKDNPEQTGVSLNTLVRYLSDYVLDHAIDVIHVHSISNPPVLRSLFSLAPVLRSMHEPRMVCPGQGKFWRYSERICNQPFGLHCIYHAYKEGCCNRHPKRLFAAYQNTQFEVREGRDNYRAIMVMSDYMKREAELVGFPTAQLVLNPYFTPEVEQIALKNQVNAKEKRLLFVGRLSRTKGVHYFIAAALQLVDQYDDLRIDIVGGGHDEGYFKSLVPPEKEQYFTFHGWQDRAGIDQIISEAYLLVFPSIYPEAFGISGIEAMMRAKPVVGFDVGGVRTWLKDRETGFAVPVKDVNALTERLALLLDNRELYDRMSTNSRREALRCFTPEIHLKRLLEIYNKAVA